MKKIILLIIAPFLIKAQTPTEKKPDEVKQTQVETKAKPSAESKAAALKLIEGYHQRVLNGESMADMAIKYSEDPGSAQNGGRYDSIGLGVMVPEFEKAAFNLKPNEISQVFETMYGYHFIQLIARKGDFVDLRHLLVIPNKFQLHILARYQ